MNEDTEIVCALGFFTGLLTSAAVKCLLNMRKFIDEAPEECRELVTRAVSCGVVMSVLCSVLVLGLVAIVVCCTDRR